jgi:hypothetical protein
METWPVDKDNRDSDVFRIYLKASNITNTKRIINSAVSISDKYGIAINSEISKSSYSIDVWVILGGLAAIDSLLNRAFSIIRHVHNNHQGDTDFREIKKNYDSLDGTLKRLVRSILQAIQKLHGGRNLVEISYKKINVKFDLENWDRILPLLNFLLEKYPAPYPVNFLKEDKNEVVSDQEILNLLANINNMEISYLYLSKLNKSSLSELTRTEKFDLLNLLKKGKR